MKKIILALLLSTLSLYAYSSGLHCTAMLPNGQLTKIYVNFNQNILIVNGDTHYLTGHIKNLTGMFTQTYKNKEHQRVYLSIGYIPNTNREFLAVFDDKTNKLIQSLDIACSNEGE